MNQISENQAEASKTQSLSIEKYLRSGVPLKFYSDSGHGWLAVKRSAVDYLNIEVSSFSYQKGNTVYLEEDSDASRFLEAYFNHTGIDQKTYKFSEKNVNGRSSIRGYQRYSK